MYVVVQSKLEQFLLNKYFSFEKPCNLRVGLYVLSSNKWFVWNSSCYEKEPLEINRVNLLVLDHGQKVVEVIPEECLGGSQGSEGLTENRNVIGHSKVTSLPLLDQNPQIWARKFPVLICSQSPQVLGGDEKASVLHGASLVPLHNQISSSMQRILVLLVLCSILLFISCCATSIAANL